MKTRCIKLEEGKGVGVVESMWHLLTTGIQTVEYCNTARFSNSFLPLPSTKPSRPATTARSPRSPRITVMFER